MDNKKLIFVYNADSSLFNQIGDLIHKTISPQTYQCKLCGLTYFGVRMNEDWKKFIHTLPVQSIFLHKDEFLNQFPNKKQVTFPVVFVKVDKNLTELISTQEINKAKNLDELKKLVQEKVSVIQNE